MGKDEVVQENYSPVPKNDTTKVVERNDVIRMCDVSFSGAGIAKFELFKEGAAFEEAQQRDHVDELGVGTGEEEVGEIGGCEPVYVDLEIGEIQAP